MKAIRVIDAKPVLVDAPKPSGDGVLVKIAAASICGSDLHLIREGWVEGRILGHEFCGTTADGTAVTVQPNIGCNACPSCDDGYSIHCTNGMRLLGVSSDGAMAEFVEVPSHALFVLPSGLDLAMASLVEPLAVAVHGLNRTRVGSSDRVLVIGAGAIGLAVGAILQSRGMAYDIVARYEHQRVAALRLGASLALGENYDVVIDAVGNSASIADAIARTKPMGRVGFVGSLWNPATLDMSFCTREIELIAATCYRTGQTRGEFAEACTALTGQPDIAATMITHRFAIEAVSEAFSAAADREAGAIKVVFDL